MLQPKKTKYRRVQKGKMKGNAQRGNQLAFGSFGIKALDECWMTGRQIEAARQAVTRYMKREGQIWIRVFPDKPITKKPAEVRMGKGRGAPEGFVAPIKPGRILIEAEGVPFKVAQEALRLAAQKLPIPVKFVVRRDYVEKTNQCKMKSSEIKELTTKELVERIDTEKTQLTRLKLNHAVSPLDNPLKITESRKDIARLKTELRKRELNENSNS